MATSTSSLKIAALQGSPEATSELAERVRRREVPLKAVLPVARLCLSTSHMIPLDTIEWRSTPSVSRALDAWDMIAFGTRHLSPGRLPEVINTGMNTLLPVIKQWIVYFVRRTRLLESESGRRDDDLLIRVEDMLISLVERVPVILGPDDDGSEDALFIEVLAQAWIACAVGQVPNRGLFLNILAIIPGFSLSKGGSISPSAEALFTGLRSNSVDRISSAVVMTCVDIVCAPDLNLHSLRAFSHFLETLSLMNSVESMDETLIKDGFMTWLTKLMLRLLDPSTSLASTYPNLPPFTYGRGALYGTLLKDLFRRFSQLLMWSQSGVKDALTAGFLELIMRADKFVREDDVAARSAAQGGSIGLQPVILRQLELIHDQLMYGSVQKVFASYATGRAFRTLLASARVENWGMPVGEASETRLADECLHMVEKKFTFARLRRALFGRCALEDCEPRSSMDMKRSRCSGCSIAAYCSRQCQQKDWPHHKSACRRALIERDFGRMSRVQLPVLDDEYFLLLIKCELLRLPPDPSLTGEVSPSRIICLDFSGAEKKMGRGPYDSRQLSRTMKSLEDIKDFWPGQLSVKTFEELSDAVQTIQDAGEDVVISFFTSCQLTEFSHPVLTSVQRLERRYAHCDLAQLDEVHWEFTYDRDIDPDPQLAALGIRFTK